MRHALALFVAAALAALTWSFATHADAAPVDAPSVWLVELDVQSFALAHDQTQRPHLAARRAAGRAALNNIEQRQTVALEQISRRLRHPVQVVQTYRMGIVGFALRLTASEAESLQSLAVVRRVIPDQRVTVPALDAQTMDIKSAPPYRGQSGDPVVDLIGAADVWDGSATGDTGHLGEGVIVGVVGSGINGDHPSFAERGGDGYEHINPFGAGVYVGECFATAALACNSKLIGRWSFINGATSEDDDGYGSFVAGLAVGNRLSGAAVADFNTSLITGVAPHANLINYTVCSPTCPATAIIAAFDQAIDDGVDVLLHTVGSPATSPWDNIYAQIALSIRAAGISMTYGVGASGPAPGSLSLSLAAPWVASFATTTHGRDFGSKSLTEFTGGATPLTTPMTGRSLTGPLTAPIVYAGDFPNPAAPGSDPAQCLQPYPAGTFDGQIVMCDRGQIVRFEKSINVAQGGAGGFVLGNVPDGPEFLATEYYAVPGIHIAAQDAQVLRNWLASGSDHVASIRYAGNAVDPAREDLVAAFNSRGPNLGLSYLAPSLAAPSLDVLGPGAGVDELVLGSARGSAPGAGALALLKSAHPQWTPAQLLSALMTTANSNLREEDQVTPTGPFDHGGGRIDVAAAAQAGLLLDVSNDEFVAANPAQSGQPETLNLAGLVNLACVNGCAWTREVQATRDDTWDASATLADAAADIVVTPATFSLDADQRQTLTIVITVHDGAIDADYFGALQLQPRSGLAPPARLPIAARLIADSDQDGVANAADNCVAVANPVQRDTNGDGYGNACDADLNDDCIVNYVDLGLFRNSYLQAGDLDADLNGDQMVDAGDLDRFRSLFLDAPGPSAAGACAL